MSDNPFSEPEDSDRTIIRPVPGGAARASARAATPLADPFQAEPSRAEPLADDVEAFTPSATGLAAAAAPLLQLLTRLRNTVRAPDAGDLYERTVREVRAFEQRAREANVPMEQLRPAHYAICASLDDVVMNTPWGGAGGWTSRSLVSTFHKEVRSGERFFQLLQQMRESPGQFMPVLELMYLCLSLGFVGRYRQAQRGPAELERVREETYAIIMRQRQAANPELAPHWRGLDAPYRPARAVVPLWVGAVAGLAAVAGVFLWVSSGLGSASDDLYARMVAAPPAQMPSISRAAYVKPVPPPPEPPQAGPMDRLRAFLAPEIAQGLVSVVGTPSTPIVRISNRGMFPPGSATVQPSFKPLLERIGAALKAESGSVQVIGYTDNQPIRTVAFSSNTKLSVERAAAARTLLLTTLGEPGRIRPEGRADQDPIASNATPEGREQNRRIEVVLNRSEP